MQQLTPRVTTSLHLLLLKSYIISVARFREMSPLRQNFKSLRQIFESLFSIWQIFEPIWQILYAIGNICAVVNGQTLENLQLASGRSHCPLSLSLSLSLFRSPSLSSSPQTKKSFSVHRAEPVFECKVIQATPSSSSSIDFTFGIFPSSVCQQFLSHFHNFLPATKNLKKCVRTKIVLTCLFQRKEFEILALK